MKRNVKLIATIVAAVMLVMSLASIGVSAAETDKFYTTVDISSAATGKFWVDPTISDELSTNHYSGNGWNDQNGYKKDFVAAGGGLAYSVKAAKYPLTIDKTSSDPVPDTAWIMTDNTLRSLSGVPYVMPRKTATAAEKEVISLGENTIASQSVNVERKTKKVHILVASSLGRDMEFSVTPVYRDNTTYTQAAQNYTIIGEGTENDPDEICKIESRETVSGNDFYNAATGGAWGGRLVLSEYTVNIDYPEAELHYLKINATKTYVNSRVGSFAVVAITTEDVSGNQRTGLASTVPALADGSYSVVASSPVEGKAVLAIYEKATNKLIAVKFADITEGNQTQTITAESENIKVGTEYAAQVMILDGMDTLVPLTNALPIG